MEKYAVPVAPIDENPRPIPRHRWKRSLIELNGKIDPDYRHDVSSLLIQSYSEIGAFHHSYHDNGLPCRTHVNWVTRIAEMPPFSCRVMGVSALEFDTKGIYLASVTKTGCLTVHEFESLYCLTNESSPCPQEDEAKQLLHITLSYPIDAVRWNLANQDEVACTSLSHSEVQIFDIGYISSEPVEILKKRPTVTVHGSDVHKGLTDVAFFSNDNSRVLASDTCGAINIWDRRVNNLPVSGLTTDVNNPINSIQVTGENQIVYGASKSGTIYMWDLRGGRSSAAFQSHKEAHSSPVTSIKLASLLNKIKLLKAQSNILPKEICSIGINPSCPNQLGFYLEDGWSGVLDIHSSFHVTHIHCPPPAWLDDPSNAAYLSSFRKPSWLPTHCIHAVGSSSTNGLHLLDFYPDPSSPCHVDYDDSKIPEGTFKHKQNRFIPLSESVTACAFHPLNGTIVAGTKQSSLLMISQRRVSCQKGDDEC